MITPRWRGTLLASAAILTLSLLAQVAPPRTTAAAAGTSWSQDAHDAQHTGASNDEPTEPWTFLWSFNGADTSGGTGSHFYNAPPDARTVAGGGEIYIPAGSTGLYALNEGNGSVVWHATPASAAFNAAPAYDPASGNLLAGGSDGNLYEYSAATGALVGTFNAGSPITHAVMLNGAYAYIVTDDGHLDKISIAGLSLAWSYAGGDFGATMPAYSPSRAAVVYGTEDRNGVHGVHVIAVNDADGTAKWQVQPTPLQPTFVGTDWRGLPVYDNVWDHGWPVIAEQHGLVFMHLALDGSPSGPITHGPLSGDAWPTGSTSSIGATTQNWLANNPTDQVVFALSLDNGAKSFLPAIGDGTTEDDVGGAHGVMGAQPVVKVWSNGDEVLYDVFRSGDCNPPDYRWTGHVGEMVLDNTTVSGLSAGQFRYIAADSRCYTPSRDVSYIVDESSPFTMAGATVFYNHWSASDSFQITNRATNLGLASGSPISTSFRPVLVHYAQGCSDFSAATHYGSVCGASLIYGNGRYYSPPGFAQYWSAPVPPPYLYDPPGNGTSDNTGFSAGFTPRYVYASDGYLVFEDNGGGLMVLSTSGSAVPTPTPNLRYTTSLSPILK